MRTEDDEVTRCAKLRNDRIEMLKKLVHDAPDEYDASKLQEAIDFVANISDEHIDAALIMQHDINILQKPIYNISARKLTGL